MTPSTGQQAEINRALGRLEGQNTHMIAKLDAMIKAQIEHEDEDRQVARELRQIISTEKAEVRKEIAKLKQDQDRAKGAGWATLGLLTVVISALGSLVISLISGHITFKWN